MDDEALEAVRALLRRADEALSRQLESARTPAQREDDFAEAVRAHRQAVRILETQQPKARVDEALVAALAPLHVEVADLEILISEIRFDEQERTERMPRLRHAGG